jgi:hypothetical protein
MPPFPQAFTGLHYSHTSLHKEPAQKPKPSSDLGPVITLYIMKTTRRSWTLGNKEQNKRTIYMCNASLGHQSLPSTMLAPRLTTVEPVITYIYII